MSDYNENENNNSQNNSQYNNMNNQNGSYYTPPNNNSSNEKPKKEKKKAKNVDENGNPIPKKKNKTLIAIIVVLVVAVVCSVIGIVVSLSDTKGENKNPQTTSSNGQDIKLEAQGEVEKKQKDGKFTVAGLAENVMDSCVGISVYTQSSSMSNFYGFGSNVPQENEGEQIKSGEGSGIIMLEQNGKTYILTCAHVISEGSTFKVTTNDHKEYDATMVGFDSQTDIGVLAINQTGFKVASFADSDQTVVGEQVVAIGCPGGLEFLNSVTSGYVSALARPISSKIGYNTNCIQTDASINPGNSGGALFNMYGQVIGVNSSKIASTDFEGMGFAVPSKVALSTAKSLIKSGYVEGRAKIGITYKNIKAYSNSQAILSTLDKLGFENAEGTMVINEITEGSDLVNKNIKPYDMIVAVNGKTLSSADILTSVLSTSKPGDVIKLTIARVENNQIDTFDVDCKLVEQKSNN